MAAIFLPASSFMAMLLITRTSQKLLRRRPSLPSLLAARAFSGSASSSSGSGGGGSRGESSGAAAVPRDHYRTLGVARDASPDAVKAAFRELAKQHHPDVGADGEIFKALNEAHRVLSDPAARAAYDGGSPPPRSGGVGTSPAPPNVRGGIVSMRHAGGTLGDEGLSPEEAFQRALARANERARESARFRATLARINRPKIEIPSMERSLWAGISPYAAAVAIWSVPFLFFASR